MSRIGRLPIPVPGAVKATTGARSLKTVPVEVGDGAIWLVG